MLCFTLLCQACQKAPAPAPIAIDLFGCTEVDRDHACWISAPRQRVRFWHPAHTATITVALDARTTTVARSTSEGGALIEIELPFPPPSRLSVEVEDGAARAHGEVPLVRYDLVPDLAEANRIRRSGGAARAETLTRPYLSAADPVVRSVALGIAGRLALAKGENQAALALLGEAIALDARLGLRSREILDRSAKAYLETNVTNDYTAATRTLAATATLAQGFDEGRVRIAGAAAGLRNAVGDYRRALTELRTIRRAAARARFGDNDLELLDREVTALRAMGRHEDLPELLKRLLALEPSVVLCLRPPLLEGVARAAWEAEQAGVRLPPELPSSRSLFQRVEAMRRTDCPGPGHAALAVLAEMEAVQGDPREALRLGHQALEEEGTRISIGGVRAAFAVGLAHLALHQPAQALEAFTQAERTNAKLVRRVEVWGLRLRHGQALEALGRTKEAIALYEAGEVETEREAPFLPLGEGQSSFAALRRGSGDRLIALHLDQGRAEAAFLAARRRHARTLGLLERSARLAALEGLEAARWEEALSRYRTQRDALEREAAEDWKLAAAELKDRQRERQERVRKLGEECDAVLLGGAKAPSTTPRRVPEGTLALAYYDLGDALVSFAATSAGLRWHRSAPIDTSAPPALLGAALLGPFAAELRRARHIVVLAEEGLGEIDVAALPFEGAPLLARAPITHSLDLSAAPREDVGAERAVVISDPRGDLPAARSETALVSERLRARGHEVLRLDGGAANHGAVLAALSDARTRFAHYAGHARFAGLDGQSSALLLAEEGTLLVTDILSAHRVPSRLILSGCETARSNGGPAEGLGIAQAFLLAGATEVVAARRTVDDATTAELMRLLYAGDPSEPLPQALRRAQLELSRDHALGTRWAAFRVLVR